MSVGTFSLAVVAALAFSLGITGQVLMFRILNRSCALAAIPAAILIVIVFADIERPTDRARGPYRLILNPSGPLESMNFTNSVSTLCSDNRRAKANTKACIGCGCLINRGLRCGPCRDIAAEQRRQAAYAAKKARAVHI
jgi:hypothetical protein